MHPMKKSAADSHNEKLHRMTRDYGSASGSANNLSPATNSAKAEGPEDSIGFGAEGGAPSARADRASRGKKPGIMNPLATYATGGAVNRARGGRTKAKGTHVNVIVAPQGAQPPSAPVIPVGAAPGVPAGGPPAMPPGGPMAGPGPGAMPPPGAVPPGLPMRKKGGRVEHSDAKEDKALIEKTLRDEGLKRARGGKVEMTAGALSGEGRLQKIKAYGARAHAKPQEV